MAAREPEGGVGWRTMLTAGVFFAGSAGPLVAQGRCGPVGDAAVYACIHGSGAQVVVLAAGAGQDSRTWAPVIDELAGFATVVTFDRPGLGQSPAVPGARTPAAIAQELWHLLRVLDLPGRAVMVGHSMGGVHVLRFADLFPASVAGVLLLDAPPPGFEEQRMALLSGAEQRQRREILEEGRARAPSIVGRERDGAATESWTFNNLPAGLPLIVAVADSQNFGELGSEEAHRSLWLELSQRWLDLSTGSELQVVAGGGHMIHADRPQFVIDLVRRLVESAN